MTRIVDWYFDYISPYPYLQMGRFADLPPDVTVQPRPVLFAALLNHWGHKGPAEIPAKRKQTYYYTSWLAAKRGLAFAGPPRHPFNPLALLRLTIVAGSSLDVVQTIYAHVWGAGNDGQETDSIARLATKLGIEGHEEKISDPAVKNAVKQNTDEAVRRGVYGVPTFAYRDELFWGDDTTDLFIDFLQDPALFTKEPFHRQGDIPAAAIRKPPKQT